MTRVRLHVGTYSQAGGRGLYPVDYDSATGFWVGPAFADAANASFGAWSPRHRLLYLVDEQAGGAIGAYRRADARWEQLRRTTTNGREPCFLELAPDQQRLAVANYSSGSVALLELDDNGLPGEAAALFANEGSGPDAERQAGPHIHCVRFDASGRWLYAVDLGTDSILRFDLAHDRALEHPYLAYRCDAGAGPRHLLLHPHEPLALLLCELDSTLSLLDVAASGITLRSTVATASGGMADNLGGHLAIDSGGTRVYVTNRGQDSIAVFALDPAARTLEPLQHIASAGASPRFTLLLEDLGLLFVANEEGNTLAAFTVRADGTLAATGHAAALPAPVYIVRDPG